MKHKCHICNSNTLGKRAIYLFHSTEAAGVPQLALKSCCARCECLQISTVILTASIYSGVDMAFIPIPTKLEYIWAYIRPTRWWISNVLSSVLLALWVLTLPPSLYLSIHPSITRPPLSNNYKERTSFKEIKVDTDINKTSWNNTTLVQIMSFISADCVPGSGWAGNWSGKPDPLKPSCSVSNADQAQW